MAVGIELNPKLVKEAMARVEALGLGERVEIILGDLMEVDISPADVVTMYLTTGANERVRPKLERELRPGARIVTHDFSIPGWEAERNLRFREGYRTHTIYLYRRKKRG